MIKFEKKLIEKEVPVVAVCNKSGKEIDISDEAGNYIERNKLHSFSVHFGYGSDFDMETWKFELDEDELLNFVRTFKVMPTGFTNEAKYPEKVFEEWKKTGKINWYAGWSKEGIEKDKKQKEEARQRFESNLKKYKELHKKIN